MSTEAVSSVTFHLDDDRKQNYASSSSSSSSSSSAAAATPAEIQDIDEEEKGLLSETRPSLKGIRDFSALLVDISSLAGGKSKEVVSFYENQNSLVSSLAEIHEKVSKQNKIEIPIELDADDESKGGQDPRVVSAIKWSFGCTVFLICLKSFVAYWSSSIAIISTAVDSALDLLSQGTMLVTSKEMSKHDPHKYPFGKSRMEPLNVVIFACVMGMAALQLLSEAARTLVDGLSSPPTVRMDAVTISSICAVIAIQVFFAVYCGRVSKATNDNASARALADDHINDVCINLIGGIPAILSGFFPSLWFLDSTGAILLSIYIAARWTKTCIEQVGSLIGTSASKELIAQVVYLAGTHSSSILKVDTVLAYNVGYRYQVECHIVLPQDMPLRQSHDIGESLEKKIECLPWVEMAFVHADYEYTHRPEHKFRNRHIAKNTTAAQTCLNLSVTESLPTLSPSPGV